MKSATVTSGVSVQLANNFQKIDAKGKTTIENIRVATKEAPQVAQQAFKVVVAHDLSMAGQLYDLKSLDVEFSRGSLSPQTLSCKAAVDLRTSGGKSNVTISSKGLNLDEYLGDVIQMPGKAAPGGSASNKQTPARPESASPTPPGQEIGPIDLSNLNLEGNINIASLVFSGMTFKDILVHLLVEKNTVTIDKCAMKINEGDVSLTGKIQTNVPGFRYDAALEVKNLAVAPFVDSFVPQLRNVIEGTMSCQSSAKGQGLQPDSLAKNLSGNFSFTMSDGQLSNVPVLNTIAELTRISELQEVRFYTAKGRFDAQNGRITIPELDFVGKQQKLGLTGWANFNQEIELQISLALGAGLEKKVQDIKYIGELLTTKDGYVELPIPIVIGGTLAKPKARFKLSESIKEVGKDLFKDALKKQLEKLRE
jgi:uncharacterized protein involved in outer membrane biogenesis